MNARHTIALGLLSWYLMMPPTAYENGEPRVISDAPLSKWKILGTFDSAVECQWRPALERTIGFLVQPCTYCVHAKGPKARRANWFSLLLVEIYNFIHRGSRCRSIYDLIRTKHLS